MRRCTGENDTSHAKVAGNGHEQRARAMVGQVRANAVTGKCGHMV
jgi:hypothetical protein